MNNLKIFLICIFLLIVNSLKVSAIIQDDFVVETLKDKHFTPVKTNLNYNYESVKKILIPLSITEKISTKKYGVYEGQPVQLKVKKNIFDNGKLILKKDTIVNARVEVYVTRGMNGIPAVIMIDNFEVPNIDSNKIKSLYIKKGINLTPIVLPIKWALTPIPGVGSLTNFIIGGNAKITPKDKIILEYYPDWQ